MSGKAVATFGEIMLRLSPPDFQLIGQNQVYDAIYGGGEANVAISLATFGDHAFFVTCLPDNPVGQGAVNSLRKWGVDTSYVQRSGSRTGIYFLEIGAVQRPSRVIYDRSHSAISEVKPGSIDWDGRAGFPAKCCVMISRYSAWTSPTCFSMSASR